MHSTEVSVYPHLQALVQYTGEYSLMLANIWGPNTGERTWRIDVRHTFPRAVAACVSAYNATHDNNTIDSVRQNDPVFSTRVLG